MPKRPRPTLTCRAWIYPIMLLTVASVVDRLPPGAAWAAAARWPSSWSARTALARKGGVLLTARRGAPGPSAGVRGRCRRRTVVGGIGQAELVEAVGGSPLSGAGLRERKGLRLPLPERVALQSEGAPASEVLEASFRSLGEGGVSVRALGAAAGGLVELLEVENSCGDEKAVGQGPGPTWQVSRSSLPSLSEGALVTLYDTTPRSDAPSGAQGAEGMKSLRLQSSDADPGAVAYNGVGGVSLEGYPREYDGVNVSFTIWSCGGATGSCSVLEDADDPGALVCEFGPPVIREGLTSMLPGETRRFWIPADVADRRFGRPLPERILPMGSLVVDMTLRSIDREAVFSFVMTPESRKLIEEKERRPETILLRGVGVGVQFLPWAYFYYQHAEADSLLAPLA